MADGELQPPSLPLPEEEHFEIVLVLDKSDLKLFKRDFEFDALGCGGAVVVAFSYLVALVGAYFGGQWLGQRFYTGDAPVIVGVLMAAAIVIVSGVPRLFTGPPRVPIESDGCLLVTMVDGLWLQSPRGATTYAWPKFSRMIVTEQAIYLGLEDRRALMLPQRALPDRNDFHTFVSVIAKYAKI